MFCPKCGYEYKPEISNCPDCDVKLVAELPTEQRSSAIEEISTQYDNWVQLARLTSKEYAYMFEEL